MLITPRISEKSYGESQKNIYVFDVPLGANKAQVAAVVAEHFPEVKIADVRLLIQKGKVKSFNRGKHARRGVAKRDDTKKAYVTLASGSIEVFKGADEYEDAPATQSAQAVQAEKVAANGETKQAGLLTRRRTGNRGDK